MSYKAKKIAIAVAAAVALFTAASVGTYYYIKGNESAQATENTEQVDNQNNDSSTDTQSNNQQSTSNDQNNDQATGNQDRTVANAGTTPTTPAPTPGTTTTTTNADGTTTRTTTNADGTTTRIRINNDGTTTTTVTNPDGTIASQTTDANVVTETEESERLVSKDDWVGWSPEAVPVPIMARIANDLGINKYKINVEKEVISTDANEDGKYDIDETITYQVKVSNIGNTTLTGIKISDKINDRENIKSMLLIDENNTLIRKIDDISEYTFDLEAGETAYFEYTYTVKEADIIDGVVENIVVATSEKAEDTDSIITETEEINEDYEVSKVADKKENVKAGDVVTYTITVKNTGNVTLNDVKVDDDMINLHKVINGLAPNTETSFTGTYTVKQQDIDDQKVITNIVTVGEKTTTEEITPEKENKAYTVEKTADKDKDVGAGETVNYTITVTNTGNVTLTNISVADTLTKLDAEGNTLSTMSLDIYEDANYTTKITTIDKLEVEGEGNISSKTLYAKYEVTQEDIDNQVKLSNTATANNTPSNPVETTVEDDDPKVTVVKDADKKENVEAGETINYTITVTNTGNVTLTNISVADTLTKLDAEGNTLSTMSLDIYEDANYTTKITTIDKLEVAGEGNISSKTLYAKYEVTQEDIDNQVKLSNTATANNTPSNPVETTVEDDDPKVTVVKDADKKENVEAGQTVHYTITVTNTGNVTLTNISVADTLTKLDAEGNTLSTMSLDIYEDANYTTKITTIDKLEVEGENNVSSKTLYAKYEVTQEDIDNQVKLSNTATANNTPSNPVETTVEDDDPKVTVVKDADKKENVEAGETINYTITVTNTGNVTLTNISVADTLTKLDAEGNTLLTMSLDIYEDANYTTKITTIDKLEVEGENNVSSKTLYAKYEVTQEDIDNQVKLSNTATANNTPSNPVETTVEDDDPKVTVVKDADKKENVEAGQTVHYTITVTNIGNVTLTNISVADTLTKLDAEGNTLSTMSLDIYEDANYTTKITTIDKLEVEGENNVSSKTLYAKYEVTQEDIDNQVKLSNTATANNTPSNPVETELELPKYPYTVISKVQEIKPVNYILVVDDSTSMANSHVADGTTTRLAAANTAINAFAKALFTNQDTSDSTQLTIVRFYGKGKADTIIEAENDYNDSTTYTVPKNTNTLGTNMEAGLNLATNYKEPSMENVVIILSDGEINNGETNAAKLKAIVYDNNTEIYSIGFGSEAADPSNSIYKKLQDISTDGKVHSSDGVDTLIAALTGAAYHDETSSKIETTTGKEIIYTGNTPLNMVTLEYKNLINPITARFNNGPGNYGIFKYSLANGVYTLSVDFSQYLDKDDLTITYYKKATQSKKSNTETLDNIDANKSESLNMKPLSSDAKNESLSKEDLTSIQDEAIANKEEDSIVKEKANNETTNITEKDNNDAETNKEETELKEDEEEKEKQSASDTKESEEKEDEKLVPEHDTEKTETSQTEKTETNEVIEENPNIINTEILEKAT